MADAPQCSHENEQQRQDGFSVHRIRTTAETFPSSARLNSTVPECFSLGGRSSKTAPFFTANDGSVSRRFRTFFVNPRCKHGVSFYDQRSSIRALTSDHRRQSRNAGILKHTTRWTIFLSAGLHDDANGSYCDTTRTEPRTNRSRCQKSGGCLTRTCIPSRPPSTRREAAVHQHQERLGKSIPGR